MDGGAWRAAVHGVAKSRMRLSDFTFTFHFHALEKEMATHSNVLAWRIPGTGEPGGLLSIGSHRVGHDWSDLAATAAATAATLIITEENLGKREREGGNFLSIISIYKNHRENIKLNGKTMNTFPLISGRRQIYIQTPLLFNFAPKAKLLT